MTCKDCIHYELCFDNGTLFLHYAKGIDIENAETKCPFKKFKNKADVVEVKHSRWENISGFDVCNVCGTSPAYWEPKPNNPKGYPPYCHNCGAKMDGVNRE